MNRIIELPDVVKNMIAAGEVVEGPFSVVKELLENAIDAGSDVISVEAEDSGLKRILVSDNGCGIAKEDILLAITEHATSKISGIEDINSILSYGFRGEALSSISSISKLTVFSRQNEQPVGAKLTAENGRTEITDYAGPQGTTVIVENLFYNTPARKKFLKAHSSEAKFIRDVFYRLAVPFNDIEFRLEMNGSKPVLLKKRKTVLERIQDIYGSDFGASLMEDSVQDMQVSMHGYISGPSFARNSRKYQFLYVNSRPVEYKTMSFHLQRAYDAILQHGQYPAAFLFINVKPELIDVNVHPAKREIKFFDSRYIDTMIYGFAKKILGSNEHAVKLNLEKKAAESIPEPDFSVSPSSVALAGRELFRQSEAYLNQSGPSGLMNEISRSASAEFTAQNIPASSVADLQESYSPVPPEPENGFRIIGIVFGVYILVEKEDNLKIIDFHAAHERIIFDELINKTAGTEAQELMFPENVELPRDEYSLVLENIEILKNRGFDIDPLSDTSFSVSSYPAVLKNPDIQEFLKDFCAHIENGTDFGYNIDKKVVERIACHSAKRKNDYLTASETALLTEKVFSGKYELRCPHGRPFLFSISQPEFEKIFKR